MNRAYVVTERPSSTELLRAVLPERLVGADTFVSGCGRSSAISLVWSLLVTKQRPVALVVDADTDVESSIREQEDFLRETIRRPSPGVARRVFLAVPTIEASFVHDREVAGRLAGHALSDDEWEQAGRHPKRFLEALSDRIRKLDRDTAASIRKVPPFNEIIRFLES